MRHDGIIIIGAVLIFVFLILILQPRTYKNFACYRGDVITREIVATYFVENEDSFTFYEDTISFTPRTNVGTVSKQICQSVIAVGILR